MIRIWYTVLCLLVFCQIGMADDKRDAEEIVKGKLGAVFAVLQKKDIDQQAKKKEIDEIVAPMFDFGLMAKLTLGRKHWPKLPREKKEKFTELYIALLKKSYLDKLALYTDEKVIFEPPAQVKKKVHIPTQLVSKDRKTSILYKLYKPANDWKVYDLEIQGVSIIRSYRSQFGETLQSGTIDDLLLKMERPADK
jgi:phospholipid transport system substrate-binding protein